MLYKSESFVYGKLLGKIIKVYIQFKLINYTGNYNYLYDSPNPAAALATL